MWSFSILHREVSMDFMAIITLRVRDAAKVLPDNILDELESAADYAPIYYEGTKIIKVTYSGSSGGDFGYTVYQVVIEDNNADLPSWLEGIDYTVNLKSVSVGSNLGLSLSMDSQNNEISFAAWGSDLKMTQVAFRFFESLVASQT